MKWCGAVVLSGPVLRNAEQSQCDGTYTTDWYPEYGPDHSQNVINYALAHCLLIPQI